MASTYELLSSDHFHVILHPDKQHGLIFYRLDLSISTINCEDARDLNNLQYKGSYYGIVGLYLKKYLVLIKNRNFVGSLYEPMTKTYHDVYVITNVHVVDISITTNILECSKVNSVRYNASCDDPDHMDLKLLGKTVIPREDHDFTSLPITINSSLSNIQPNSTQWNPFKIASSLKPMVARQFLKSAQPQENTSECDRGQTSSSQPANQIDDSEKSLVDEMVKLFNNTNSFYYSTTINLTDKFSRKSEPDESSISSWKIADKRFFWNRHMINDLIKLSEREPKANPFICVILHGFIAIETHDILSDTYIETNIDTKSSAINENVLNIETNYAYDDNHSTRLVRNQDETERNASKSCQLALISRRSVFQAGTRYRRRGCDDDGNVANYVETEQIFRYGQHFKSLTIVRGSIPLYWCQTNYNYRPPPVMMRSEDENHQVFSKHFASLMEFHETQRIISIDCTEQTGREKILHEAYRKHMDKLKETQPVLELIQFDFHRHCKGRQCTDSQIERHLISCGLTDRIMKEVKYYWNDGDVVLRQDGLFRVNCLDCSDRTNVVQRAIALKILDLQLARLGFISPDTNPENNACRKIMFNMWSANGNVLSTQYCGTRALFGGDRKLSGYLKDTYSSASRYYMSKFRDHYRQAAIDAMLGVESPPMNPPDTNHREFSYPGSQGSTQQSSGTFLRVVGNRVTNRLARLKGRVYVKPYGMENISASTMAHDNRYDVESPEMVEDGLEEALENMSIDWPASECMEEEAQTANDNLFARYSKVDDSYQDDDEFGQLMLSIDVAELQRLQEPKTSASESNSKDSLRKHEEINLSEARDLTLSTAKESNVTTCTTSS